jgi:hypothetical protein
MKIQLHHLCLALTLLALAIINAPLATAHAQGTAFTYQGRLNSGSAPANGNYDVVFALYNDPLIGSQVGSAITNSAVPVTNGLFTTTIDFGGAPWTGQLLYLQMLVRTNGNGTLTPLIPRQQVTPAPYAILAGSSSNLLGSLSAAQVSGGSLPVNVLPGFSANNLWNTISGGLGNLEYGGFYNTIGGGENNTLNGAYFNVIAGGQNNLVSSSDGGAIGGGTYNNVTGQYGVITGGSGNTNSGDYSFIGGGGGNFISGDADGSVISGGEANSINSPDGGEATIGGGFANVASAAASTIAGGEENQTLGDYSTIGGGLNNTNYSQSGTVAGGQQNVAYGQYQATVGGGYNNTASANYATVPGGYQNIASGSVSFAAGTRAQALHQGAFVWADDSVSTAFSSTANNQFLIRAQGGVGINTAVTPDDYFSINTNAYLFSHVLYLRGDSASDHNHGLAYNGNTVTNFGTGNYQVDGPALWGYTGGLLGTRNGGDHAALTWNTTGVTINGTVTGNASGLTNLNAAQLNGNAILNNLTLNGTLNLPGIVTIYAGGGKYLYSDGVGNFFLGQGAGNPAVSGFNNVGFGENTLAADTNGGNNTAIGYSALSGTTSGSKNIALGYEAGLNISTGSSNIDIGNFGISTDTNIIRIGTSQTQTYIAGFINGNGTGLTNVSAATLNGLAATNFWQLGGNNVASGQFLGSTNNQPVEIWVNGARALRLEPGGTSANVGNGIPTGAPNVIGGSPVNYVVAGVVGAVIGGGGATNYGNSSYTNSVAADFGTIGGGLKNFIQPAASASFLGGGSGNSIQTNAFYSFLGGGADNSIQTNASASFLGGGGYNFIQPDATYSFLGGGFSNSIGMNAQYASVLGGTLNIAAGNYSLAAGQQAQALHQGAFVWADSQGAAFASTANDQFLVRAQGGVGINMNNPNGASLYVKGNRIPSGGNTGWNGSVAWFENTSTAANAAPALRVICDGGTNQDGALSVSSNGKGLIAEFGNAGGFPCVITNDGTIYCKNTVLTSDRALKENFTPLDGGTVLARVAAMPVTEWNYKDDGADKKHIGPMAQDFQAAFGLNGGDDKHISTVDEGGVALAAIQGLNQKVEEKDVEIADLRARLEKLEQLMTEKLGGAK